jgi:hypothetical protein
MIFSVVQPWSRRAKALTTPHWIPHVLHIRANIDRLVSDYSARQEFTIIKIHRYTQALGRLGRRRTDVRHSQ